MTENPAIPPLSDVSREVVRATLPVVAEHATEITGVFYASMFAAHPELLDLFNQGNQANGRQRAALAAAVVAYGGHLTGTGPARPDFGPIAERIAHKHVSLGIRPDQYLVVGRHLLEAVVTVLGVGPDVVAAWHEVYWLLACELIAAEARLYASAGVEPVSVWRRWRVAKRQDEAVDTVSFTLVPDDGGPVPDFHPGQYVSVAVDLPDGHRQPRQYSLSQGPGRGCLRITVRRVGGGAVSNFLHDHVRADDTVLVGPPAGDTALADGTDPVVLISAGVGVTPMAAMLDHLSHTQPTRPVVLAHAERSADRHAHHAEMTHLAATMTSVETRTAHGHALDVDEIPLPDNAHAYLCGPIPFMHGVRAALLDRGVPADRIHYEVFGPGMYS
ncbi:globin domain-containing protein [Actinokineospora auranticolor]|uniref:nitric oxide dioxygenase n=1 Tax=Actinokineospora auranticolor TaxID=155976 RepID=A0A2S6GSZ7_9PSEU|nr:globin domain-containing protein [Actinokineospora auranticolor]PPK68330.1 nitric oxide dioxygenase [Actinokineospora auranticolor]